MTGISKALERLQIYQKCDVDKFMGSDKCRSCSLGKDFIDCWEYWATYCEVIDMLCGDD